MTSEDVRIRALKRHQRTYRQNRDGPDQILHRLVLEVDRFKGEPSEKDILELAWKYHEFTSTVKTIFELKEERLHAKARQPYTQRNDGWTEEEYNLIASLWEKKNGQLAKDFDKEAAETLNRLPINVQRGIKRTVYTVSEARRRMRLSALKKECYTNCHEREGL